MDRTSVSVDGQAAVGHCHARGESPRNLHAAPRGRHQQR